MFWSKQKPCSSFPSFCLSGRIHIFFRESTLCINGFSSSEQFDSIYLDYAYQLVGSVVYNGKYEDNTYRSSHRRCSIIKGFLRNFGKFTRKHLWQSLVCNKVAGLRPAILLKEKLWHMCEFCEISKNTLFTEHLWVTAFARSFNSSSVVFDIGSKQSFMRTNFIRTNKLRLAQYPKECWCF